MAYRFQAKFTFLAAVIVVGSALGSLWGCASSTSEDLHEAKVALARWMESGPSSYVYAYRRSCFCPGAYNDHRVVVKDGKVTNVVGQQSGILVTDPDAAKTMTDWLEFAVDKAGRGFHRFDATYDDELGYLISLSADPEENAVDEEYGVSVTCFASDTKDSLCPVHLISAEECDGSWEVAPDSVSNISNICGVYGVALGLNEDSGQVCCR